MREKKGREKKERQREGEKKDTAEHC